MYVQIEHLCSDLGQFLDNANAGFPLLFHLLLDTLLPVGVIGKRLSQRPRLVP